MARAKSKGAESSEEAPSAAHGILAGLASGAIGRAKDRLVRGVARPLAGGLVVGAGLAVAVGISLHDVFAGLAGLIVAPYSEPVRTIAQGAVALFLLALAAFVSIRLALRVHGKAGTKSCPACLEQIPAEATKCRSCSSDV